MLLRQGNGMDTVLAIKPVREWLVERPILGRFFSRIFTVDDLYDGITGSLIYSQQNLVGKNYAEFEKAGLDNLHSAGFVTGICQTSSTCLHLVLIRHGMVFQVMDPWPTSWYGCVWEQSAQLAHGLSLRGTTSGGHRSWPTDRMQMRSAGFHW